MSEKDTTSIHKCYEVFGWRLAQIYAAASSTPECGDPFMFVREPQGGQIRIGNGSRAICFREVEETGVLSREL